MKKGKREQKYIGFLLGMIVTMLLCFGLICVTAEPTEAPVEPVSPVETETVPTQEVPAETTAQPEEPTATPTEEQTPPTETAATNPPTQEVPTTVAPPATTPPKETANQQTPTPATQAPTTGGTATETVAPPASQTPAVTPSATEQTTLVPTLTPTVSPTPMDTTPPFTMGHIDPDRLLPTYKPQITPGKTEETAPTEPALDMHGYVIRIVATWDEYQDICLNTEAIAAFEAKYNCKVQFLDLSQETLYNRLFMSKATGVTYFDAILVEGTEILVNLEPLGVLQSFSQYMTEAELAAVPVSYQKFLSKDGVLYGLPAKAPDVSGIWYNPDVITKYQYTSPLTDYQAGKWSWNRMTSFLREATRDLDSDGFFDTYGIATSSPWYLSVLETTGGSLFRWDGTKFLPGVTNSISVQGLNFTSNLYVSRYVASDYERYFYTSQAPYLAGELSMYPKLKSYLNGKLSFLPYPSSGGAAPYMAVATSVPSVALTATAVYPEQTAELLKILYGPDALNQRIETYCAESGFSKQIKETYLSMLNNFTVDYTDTFDTTGEIQTKLLSALKNQTNLEARLRKNIQPLLEQAIAEKSQKVNLEEVPVEIRW